MILPPFSVIELPLNAMCRYLLNADGSSGRIRFHAAPAQIRGGLFFVHCVTRYCLLSSLIVFLPDSREQKPDIWRSYASGRTIIQISRDLSRLIVLLLRANRAFLMPTTGQFCRALCGERYYGYNHGSW
jgi:hypothetical protein